MWAAEGDEITSIANIVDGKSYYIKGVRNVSSTPTTYYLTFTDATGSQSGTESSTKAGAQLITFHLVSSGVYTLETSTGKFIAPGTSNGKIAVSASGVNVTASNQSSKIRLSIVSGTGNSATTWSIQKNTSSANFGGYKNTQTDITLIEGPDASAVSKPTISGLESFLTSTEVSISCSTTGATIQYSTNGGTTWNNYSAAFTLTETTTVQSKATKSGLTDSEVAIKTFTKVTPMTVAAAIAYIDLGENLTGQYVAGKISQIDSYASNKITYWISDDGTTTNQMEVYQGKGLNGANFSAKTDLTVGDEVVVSGDLQKYGDIYEFSANSELLSFIPKVKAPTFSPAAGAVAANTEVTISTTTEGATIYYTTDGTNPTTTSSVYSAAITIDAAKTIKAFAVKDGHPDSDIATAAYTIAEPCATPTFSPAAGEVDKGATVTISTETTGATIYYTTDGSTPTTSSTAYSSAITINSAKTIKAIAVKDGMANSAVAEAAYTVRDYTTLPFNWAGGTSAALTGQSGVTANGLGSDYADSNAPYRVKMDNANDYIQIKTNARPGRVTVGVKMIGGATTSKIKVQESTDGSTFTDIEEFTISGKLNDVVNLATSKAFNTASRYVKIIKSVHGSNIGVGPIGIAEYSDVVLVPSVTYTTLTSDYALDITNVYGMTAYIVKDNDASDGYVTLTQVNKVPANTGLILKVNSPGYPYSIPVLTGAADDVTGNLMAGSATATTAVAANAGYILKEGVFQPSSGGDLPAGKAYLNIAVSAPTLTLDFGGTTGIKSVDNGQVTVDSSEVYNLNGQRVAQPTKGLYIVNGKKVIIK